MHPQFSSSAHYWKQTNTGVLHFVQDDDKKIMQDDDKRSGLLLSVSEVRGKDFTGVGFFNERGLACLGGIWCTEGFHDAAGVVAAAHGHAAGA
jgi:hypothetical protein